MKAKEYGAWPTRNVLSGGQRYSYDEYNREYKKVRYKSAEEYACRNVKEYNHYPEYKDMTSDDDKQQEFSATGSALQFGAMLRKTNSANKLRRLIKQVVCIVAGSTIIVSTYQYMNSEQIKVKASSQPTAVASEIDNSNNSSVDDAVQDVTDAEEEVNDSLIDEDSDSSLNEDYNSSSAEDTNSSSEEEAKPSSVASVEWKWNDDNTAVLMLYDEDGKLIAKTPADIGER